jgi:hypothetical protein
MVQPDLSFVREGKPLHQWLPELISSDPTVRKSAGDAVMAMMWGVPSVHTDLNDIEGGLPDMRSLWDRAVREAVEHPTFARNAFFTEAARSLVKAQQRYMDALAEENARLDRRLAIIDQRLSEAKDDVERKKLMSRRRRAITADTRRDMPEGIPDAMSVANAMLTGILEVAGPAWLEASDALRMLLASKHHRHVALKALEAIGPAAREFTATLLVAQEQGEDVSAVLASVARTDSSVTERMLKTIEDATARAGQHPEPTPVDDVWSQDFWPSFYRRDGVWPAATTLMQQGRGALDAPGVGQRVIPTLLNLSQSCYLGHRGAAAFALGPLGALVDGPIHTLIVDRLMAMTHDHAGVAGRAIDSLGQIAADAARVVPRLAELFDEFKEFDPDTNSYHERLCRALECFGPAAAPAVPRLVTALGAYPLDDEAPRHLFRVLAAIGPAASSALPHLKTWAAGWGEPLPEAAKHAIAAADLLAAIARIEGTDADASGKTTSEIARVAAVGSVGAAMAEPATKQAGTEKHA